MGRGDQSVHGRLRSADPPRCRRHVSDIAKKPHLAATFGPDAGSTRWSKHFLNRSRQHKTVLLRVEAREPRLLGSAGKAFHLPNLPILEHGMTRIVGRVANAPALALGTIGRNGKS